MQGSKHTPAGQVTFLAHVQSKLSSNKIKDMKGTKSKAKFESWLSKGQAGVKVFPCPKEEQQYRDKFCISPYDA